MGSRPVWMANTDSRTTYTGSTTAQTFVTLGPFKFQPNSTNIVLYGAAMDGASTGTDVFLQLHNGTSVLDKCVQRTATTAANGGIFNMVGFAIITAGGSPSDVTLTVQYGLDNNGAQTAGIQDAYIVAFPLGSQDVVAEDDTETTISAGSWAAGTDKVTLSFTPATSGDYVILAKAAIQPQTTATDGEARLWNGTTAYNLVDNWAQRTSTNIYGAWLGGYKGTLSGAQTWKIQTGANANSIKVKQARMVALRVDDLCEVVWGESRGTSTTTSTTIQIKASATHTAVARPYIQLICATMKHNQTTFYEAAMTVAGAAIDAIELQAGSTTATNYQNIRKLAVVTPSAGSRTIGIGYNADTADTTTIEEAWVLAIRPNVYMPPRVMGHG